MTELIRILYDYAFEHQLDYYLDDQTQYRESEIITDRQYTDLQKLLGRDGQQRLDDYTGDLRTKHNMELEAMFRAGLALGQELSRL